MTGQEKKAWLGRYQLLDQQIQRLVEEKAVWRARAEKITPNYGDQPGGDGGDRIQCATDKIDQLEAELCQRIDESERLKEEIYEAIKTVDDPTQQLLLEYRYINGDTWERIAEKMNYGDRQVYRLHGEALSQIKMS